MEVHTEQLLSSEPSEVKTFLHGFPQSPRAIKRVAGQPKGHLILKDCEAGAADLADWMA
jgi:hypothetical protein